MSATNEKLLRGGIAVVSTGVVGFLMWLVYLHPASGRSHGALDSLPSLNAFFNLLCAVFLVAGWREIRRGRRNRHIAFMLAALTCSALFLAGYVTHHYTAGDTPFRGQGLVRPVYFAILITHILATIVALPMILMTVARAATGRFAEHRRIARRTLPLWLYVSLTGVLVFAFLRWWS
jgi:putative membrane protein